MNDSSSELTFEIGGDEYTAVLSNADASGGIRVSIRASDGRMTLVTEPYEVFHSSAEALNAARTFAAEQKPNRTPPPT
jgi:hypothetical protein